MTARQEIQYCYELAFYPPRLNQVWHEIQRKKRGKKELRPLLDKALMLHQALPEEGFASQRALQRLALYQAKSRAFGRKAGRPSETKKVAQVIITLFINISFTLHTTATFHIKISTYPCKVS